MKRPLLTISLIALLGTVALGAAPPAYAGNSGVEAGLQNYGDLSMFYQALLNTGVINELRENQRYTVFAPTNAAFLSQINRESYPCFYAVQCRPQIAMILRNHIIENGYDLRTLASYGQGLHTIGNQMAYISQPYVDDYEIDGHRILSHAEISGNTIYRIDGVITTPQELNQFQTVAFAPTANTVTTTTVRKTYVSDPAINDTYAYPSGTMVVVSPDDASQSTTVTRTTTTEQ